MKRLLLSVLVLAGCSTASEVSPDTSDSLSISGPAAAANRAEVPVPLNVTCPRSGKPVAADSLTEYRGYVVGFCNTHCRDDFAANVDERPDDTSFFDAAIAAFESASARLP